MLDFNPNNFKSRITKYFSVFALGFTLFLSSAHAIDDPAGLVENTVNQLFVEFTEKRDKLAGNNSDLFNLVDRIAGPLFDFNYISKLVLAKSWKKASDQQRLEFAREFKRLIIVTYATALFKYTGNEKMEFGKSKLKQKKGVNFGTVNTEVSINDGAAIPVVYSLIQTQGEPWKIYNLTVGSLNMVLNFRNVIQSSIHSDGLEGVITKMKENNDKNY